VLSQTPFVPTSPPKMPLASAICHLVNERKEPKKLERFTWALALLNIHPFFVWGPPKKNKKKNPSTCKFRLFADVYKFSRQNEKSFPVFDKVKLFFG